MILDVRFLEEDDYDNILSKWWLDWGWSSPPSRAFLPKDGTGGMIVYEGDTPICAGFVYETNSKCAWVEWIVSNRQYREKPNRYIAIQLLIGNLTDLCDIKGFKYIYSNNNNKHLIEHFKKQGFIVGSTNSTELIKKWD